MFVRHEQKKNQLKLKLYKFKKWYQLKVNMIVDRADDRMWINLNVIWPPTGFRSAEVKAGGGRGEGGTDVVRVQHMLRKRFFKLSPDAFRPKHFHFSTRLTLCKLSSLHKTASKPHFGCVVTVEMCIRSHAREEKRINWASKRPLRVGGDREKVNCSAV